MRIIPAITSPKIIHLLPLHLFRKMLIDLAILTDWATRTHRIAVVLVKDIQPRDGKGHLAGMAKLTGAEISSLPKKLKT